MIIKEKNNVNIAIIETSEKINTINDIFDLMATAYYSSCDGLVVKKESLIKDFFDLKTGIAGEVLQKFSNYRMKIAIIGDFSEFKSESLRDFIYECNKGSLIFFKSTEDEGINVIANIA